jgi:hypothetical protein
MLCMALPIELLIDQCTSYDEEFVLGTQNALASLAEEERAFAYFDLGLLPYEQAILQQLEIDRFNIAMYAWNGDSLQKPLTQFMQVLSGNDHNQDIASIAASAVTRIISHIVDASPYNVASVVISTVLPLSAYDEPTIMRYGLGKIDWHVDKSFADIAYHRVHPEIIQHNYLVTLKGPSTLYYAAEDMKRHDFLTHSEETMITFGCASRVECPLSNFIESAFVSTAKHGQGSVHYAGWKKGAIHAAPPEEERLIMVVVPEEQSILGRYLRTDFEL